MKLPIIAIAALSMLCLGACAPKALTPEEMAVADCTAQGGTMQRVGRLQSLQCVIRYADAGQRCSDGDDCLGDCRVEGSVLPPEGRAVTGVCQATSNRFGCFTTIEDGKAEATLCID
ncbi:hypothetical protein [Brevundimonas sp.]|jgi:hypothetical protein|uniref:hypothetical protein n=1 Tax=Brevundimonas sp. TaxID=1871086 RepID=UPI002ABBE95B|nr:hypothetical protein [Brevundimonas sp.]MDZ4362408.1 hypothetical protein [Brevundimonas sp.]